MLPGQLDPMTVLQSLPPAMRDAFVAADMQQLQAALDALPDAEREYHMQRVRDAGMWTDDDPAARAAQEARRKQRAAAEREAAAAAEKRRRRKEAKKKATKKKKKKKKKKKLPPTAQPPKGEL